MIIEVMGHKAGWIALYSGVAGGGDVILIPEIKFDENIVCKYLMHRALKQKKYSIVVVAEGIPTKNDMKAGEYIAKIIQETIEYETRVTVLGYIQRGGTPSPTDRILATRYGTHAVDLIAEGNFGRMVAIQGNNITSIPLYEVEGKTRLVDPLFPLIKKARSIGTCFGDKMP
jgi:6-phosphofructokinase 1